MAPPANPWDQRFGGEEYVYDPLDAPGVADIRHRVGGQPRAS